MKKHPSSYGPEFFQTPEAYRLHVAYEGFDRDRVVGYVDRMLERAGWELKPRISDGCFFSGSGGGFWWVNLVDINLTLTASAEGRHLAVTVEPRDLERVPSPGARLGSDVLRAVRKALS